MRRRLCWPILISLLLGAADAQAPLPTTTYKLHAQREQHSPYRPTTLLYLLPDQALLVLIPQQNGKWLFKRLTAWDTGNPREQTLGFTSQLKHQEASGHEDLKVNPASTYAVIRIRSLTRSTHPLAHDRSAVVVLVDLRSFTIVSQRTTSDPLLAASWWAFAKNGLLIAKALTNRAAVRPKPKRPWTYQTITDTYRAAAFTLPGWESTMPCEYERFFDNLDRSRPPRWSIRNASNGCAALVASAQVASAENLPDDGISHPIPDITLAGPSCYFAAVSPSADFALYACRTGSSYMDGEIVTTHSRDLTILSVPDGRPVLKVPLPHNLTPYPALLANAGGHAWLLLLRDGIKLETYRLP